MKELIIRLTNGSYIHILSDATQPVLHCFNVSYPSSIPQKKYQNKHDTILRTYMYIPGGTIRVKHLAAPIDIEMPMSTCRRPKCWYYNEVTRRFTDAGVFTNVVNSTVFCLAHHLSGFTLRTGMYY